MKKSDFVFEKNINQTFPNIFSSCIGYDNKLDINMTHSY
jgi:hypothetical protein